MTKTKSVTFINHNAWKVLLGLYILVVILGVGEFIQGQGGDPGMVEAISGIPWVDLNTANPGIVRLLDVETRIIGSLWAGIGILGISICFSGFKRGEIWAWYSLWALPLIMALVLITFLNTELVPGAPTPPALYSAPFSILISSLTLVFSFRKFFPRAEYNRI